MTALTLVFPPQQQFTCQSCTRCCRDLRVQVAAEYARDVRARVPHHHGDLDPFEADPEGRLWLRQVEGTCIYLREDGLCSIHATLGADAKPPTCRRFPFSTFLRPDRVAHVRTSFYCPTIIKNEGAPATDLEHEVLASFDPIPLPEKYKLDDILLSGEEYAQIEEVLVRLIESATDLPLGLALGAQVLARIVGKEPISEFTKPEQIQALLPRIRPYERERDARLLLVPFLLLGVPATQSRPSRLLHAARLILGAGAFLTAATRSPVDLGRLAQVRFDPNLQTQGNLVRRYLVHMLTSRAMLAGLPVDAAYTQIGAAYALMRWYARAFAVLGNRDNVSEEDIVAAVRALDGYHFAHNLTQDYIVQGSWVGIVLDLFLKGPSRFAGLVLEPHRRV